MKSHTKIKAALAAFGVTLAVALFAVFSTNAATATGTPEECPPVVVKSHQGLGTTNPTPPAECPPVENDDDGTPPSDDDGTPPSDDDGDDDGDDSDDDDDDSDDKPKPAPKPDKQVPLNKGGLPNTGY